MLDSLKATRSLESKPMLQQVFEALMLRLRKPPIGIGEYFEYRIWHRSVTPQLRNEFIGWRQSAELDRYLNQDSSRVLANDKLITYSILQSQGLPIPTPIATYTDNKRRIGDEIALRTLESVHDFLQQDVYPFYVKPISAGYGRDVLGVAKRVGDELHLMDGSSIDVESFLKPFTFIPYRGMLFQKPLRAHPEIERLTGSKAVSSIRFICLVTPNEPMIHTAFWKVAVGNNMLDNFAHGHHGNCLASVDLDDGSVTSAISRMGPDGGIDRHPITKEPLIGFALPDWHEAVELVKAASSNFPGLRLQNWDVACTESGPVIIELNTESDLAVPQAISGRGLMDRGLSQVLEDIKTHDESSKDAIIARSKQ